MIEILTLAIAFLSGICFGAVAFIALGFVIVKKGKSEILNNL